MKESDISIFGTLFHLSVNWKKYNTVREKQTGTFLNTYCWFALLFPFFLMENRPGNSSRLGWMNSEDRVKDLSARNATVWLEKSALGVPDGRGLVRNFTQPDLRLHKIQMTGGGGSWERCLGGWMTWFTAVNGSKGRCCLMNPPIDTRVHKHWCRINLCANYKTRILKMLLMEWRPGCSPQPFQVSQ